MKNDSRSILFVYPGNHLDGLMEVIFHEAQEIEISINKDKVSLLVYTKDGYFYGKYDVETFFFSNIFVFFYDVGTLMDAVEENMLKKMYMLFAKRRLEILNKKDDIEEFRTAAQYFELIT